MKRTLYPVAALAICLVILNPGGASFSADSGRGKGALHRAGRVDVLYLRGSFREMGRQYGALQREKLRAFHADMIKLFVEQRAIPPARLRNYARALFESYPQRLREILAGMSETSGLTLDEHLVINAFEHFLFHQGLVQNGEGACSAIAAWGPCAPDGLLVFGRNYDFGIDVGEFKKYVSVAVFDPEGSGIPTALITFTGTLNATTQMNGAGIFLELNNGGVSAGTLGYTDRISAPAELFGIMLDSPSMAQVEREMHTKNTPFAYIINVADGHSAVSYEWAPFGVRKISGRDGLLVSTNHFVDDWGMVKSTDDFYLTVTRRKNLLRLAGAAKGKINVEKMKNMLDTPIRNGGATSYRIETIDGKPTPYTAYQVIGEPERRRITIKIPGYQDWIAVDLERYFKSN